MMGRGYVTEHCIATANYEEKLRAQKIYDSECLRMMTENLSILTGILSRGEVQIPYMAKSVTEMFESKAEPKKQEKQLTAEQVIADIMADLGKKENQAESSA